MIENISPRFEFEGQQVPFQPLKIKYQREWIKAFAPLLESASVNLAQSDQKMVIDESGKTVYQKKGFDDLSVADWLNIGAAMANHADIFARLVQILCHNAGVMVSNEELDNSTLQPEALQDILLGQCTQPFAGKMEKEVASLLLLAKPALESELSGAIQNAKAQILNPD